VPGAILLVEDLDSIALGSGILRCVPYRWSRLTFQTCIEPKQQIGNIKCAYLQDYGKLLHFFPVNILDEGMSKKSCSQHIEMAHLVESVPGCIPGTISNTSFGTLIFMQLMILPMGTSARGSISNPIAMNDCCKGAGEVVGEKIVCNLLQSYYSQPSQFSNYWL